MKWREVRQKKAVARSETDKTGGEAKWRKVGELRRGKGVGDAKWREVA